MNSIVSIIRCEDYSEVHIRKAVAQAIELAELRQHFREWTKVLLKPNLLSSRLPDEAVTTHPSVVEAAGRIAKEANCDLLVGDSPPFAGENAGNYARLCERTGASGAAAHVGARLIRFEESITTVPNPEGKFYRSFELASAVMDADLIVNLPKLKTHGLTAFSGAVKNIFGCVPGIRKGLFHAQAAEDPEVFAQMLVDLLRVLRPAVNIMDAVVAMEGEGPNSGNPRHLGLVLASSDPVALDAVACSIVGIDPMSVATTRLAHEQGLGNADLSSITIRGESLESVAVPDFTPSSGANDWIRIPPTVRRIIRRQLVAAPVVRSKTCIGCGACSRVCPVSAISPGRPPGIDLNRCIRCYCCHEVCDPAAIDLRRGWLGNVAFRVLGKR